MQTRANHILMSLRALQLASRYGSDELRAAAQLPAEADRRRESVD